jgi:hypothetical protein
LKISHRHNKAFKGNGTKDIPIEKFKEIKELVEYAAEGTQYNILKVYGSLLLNLAKY